MEDGQRNFMLPFRGDQNFALTIFDTMSAKALAAIFL